MFWSVLDLVTKKKKNYLIAEAPLYHVFQELLSS